ncbi:MAG: hypothetical protein KZQ78_06025 [Candidatus Thiodiazotropha sp. (ex Ustalcina ferruginea)]|nr:hypothetical protein [Candidatus Thiodiazotropha sp. (ex Ustalcina ferruginea)]
MSLDRGTKIYAAVLGGILLLVLLGWLLTLDFRLGEIDALIQQDQQTAAYPYPFRALDIIGTTAIISSPRSNSMPAVRFLGIINPSLRNKSTQDLQVIAAQKELAAIQSKVKKRVLARDDIDKVRWRIDKEWFSQKGVWLE